MFRLWVWITGRSGHPRTISLRTYFAASFAGSTFSMPGTVSLSSFVQGPSSLQSYPQADSTARSYVSPASTIVTSEPS